jgi:hypothetical protein
MKGNDLIEFEIIRFELVSSPHGLAKQKIEQKQKTRTKTKTKN